MARLKTQSNLRQKFREVVERAHELGINAELKRGYLYWTDEISDPKESKERQVWADEIALQHFHAKIELAEKIATERDKLTDLLIISRGSFEKAGIKIDNVNDWWMKHETPEGGGFLQRLETSHHFLLNLAVSIIKATPPF